MSRVFFGESFLPSLTSLNFITSVQLSGFRLDKLMRAPARPQGVLSRGPLIFLSLHLPSALEKEKESARVGPRTSFWFVAELC